MHSRFVQTARSLRRASVLCLWCLGACAPSTSEGSDDEAGPAPRDAESSASDNADGAASSSVDASVARDAMVEAARPQEGGAGPGGPGAVDATAARPDAGDAAAVVQDAGSDGGGPHARICGNTTNWPAPLSSDANLRKAQLVGGQSFGFLEGPVWVAAQGVLLFSDMDFSTSNGPMGPSARIRRLKPPATFDEFTPSSNSNGLALSADGSALIAATHDTQSLSLFDPTSAARTKLDILYQGKHFNSPNDLTVRSDGTVYFTDPDWQLGPRTSETKKTGVYRVSPPLSSGTPLSAALVDDTLTKPNGIALSPDEKTLYVGSSGSEIWKYRVAADGSVSDRAKFSEPGPSDGMTVDCAGNLYVSAGSVQVFAPDGQKLGDITLSDNPSNLAFGGADRKTLYITAGAKLYSIALNVPGYPY